MAELGFDIETNGIALDDVHATDIRDQYIKSSTDNLRYLLLHPRMRQVKNYTSSDILKIQTSQSYEELKKYFNPQSTTAETRITFSNLVMTARAKFGLMMYKLHYDLQSSSVEEMTKDYPILMPLYQRIIGLGVNMDEIKTLSDDERAQRIIDSSKKKVQCLDFYVKNA